MYVLVAQSCLTLCNPMDCSPSGSSVPGILQARILKGVAIPFSRESSQPRDQIWVFCIADSLLPELPGKLTILQNVLKIEHTTNSLLLVLFYTRYQ